MSSASSPIHSQHRPHKSPAKRHLPVNLLLVENRIREFMEHSTRYAFMGPARLAKDCGVSDAAICRLLGGSASPSFAMMVKIARAFEKEFRRPIDPREIAMIDGEYITANVCTLLGCKGCTPQSAWNRDDTLRLDHTDDDAPLNELP